MSYDDTTGGMSSNVPTADYELALRAVTDQDDRRFEVDIRRFALEAALKFTSRGVGLGGIQNHASILLCAEEFRQWLDSGALPDIDKEIEAVAAFSWNMARSLFPASLVAQANAEAQE